MTDRLRVAVVGSGISGLTCAHVLGPHHDVTLFEADDRLGGHTNTVVVDDPDVGELGVDTGFIVHNDRNYPNLVRLFEELGVETADTEMSFGVTDCDPASPTSGFTYRATNLNSIFADRRNLTNPAMWAMLRDIVRFYRHARRFLRDPDPSVSLGQFLAKGRYSREFTELHLVPMGAAVWSADPSTFDEFPAQALLTFLRNHGLLGVGSRPQWRTVPGGNRRYVEAIAARFGGTVALGAPVTAVTRLVDGGVQVRANGTDRIFDAVVLAVHSDQALAMLDAPTVAEKEILSAIQYQPNRATLHTDLSLLPPKPGAWAAWNYQRRAADSTTATLTYDMTALQHLSAPQRYLVSLNSDELIDPDSAIASIDYAHPVFDRAAIDAQGRVDELDGEGGVYFCGAWLGYGFHEDGVTAALRVCEQLGVRWPSGEPMMPGPAAVCEGTVFHRRTTPVHHEFSYPVSYVWVDPDEPEDLCRHHPLWSASRPAPARFRRSDYGDGSSDSLADQVRNDLAAVLGHRPAGPVRMLTQMRRWGWLFNPITVFLAWDSDAAEPVGAVLEVTNTPWKERHRYPVALQRNDTGGFTTRMAKTLHVSPFLDENFDYELTIHRKGGAQPVLDLTIDVVPSGGGAPVVATALRVTALPGERRVMTRTLATRFAPTQRVSAGIHVQAARLWAKRVPFVPHPRKREATT